mmetsp:Transcript_138178/g.254160  ORF Transcript_138178/g.254160 Transcript_138178/m.254160 type:complete len:200 (-) Transcript_138178:114-713(-)
MHLPVESSMAYISALHDHSTKHLFVIYPSINVFIVLGSSQKIIRLLPRRKLHDRLLMILQICGQDERNNQLSENHHLLGRQAAENVAALLVGDIEDSRSMHVLENRLVIPEHGQRVSRVDAEYVLSAEVAHIMTESRQHQCHSLRVSGHHVHVASLGRKPESHVGNSGSMSFIVILVRWVPSMELPNKSAELVLTCSLA